MTLVQAAKPEYNVRVKTRAESAEELERPEYMAAKEGRGG